MFFSFWPHKEEFSRTPQDLTADFFAGLTVAIVALPLAIGFGIALKEMFDAVIRAA